MSELKGFNFLITMRKCIKPVKFFLMLIVYHLSQLVNVFSR